MKKGQKETKVTKAVTAKPKSAVKKAASAKVAPKKGIKEIVASSASPLVANETRASTRRNAAADIHRTDRFKNISDGVIPFKYTYGVSNKSNLNIRDTVVLCQKAYYNFAVFRNTIDMMTEFSTSDVYYRGGSKKSREFFEALFGKIGLWSVMDKFFREYYRSGNVFVYRFDALLKDSDVKKITKTFGSSRSEKHLPVRYTILNPADIQIQGGLNFVKGIYYKILTDYELARLRNPRTGVREQIKNTKSNLILVPLDSDKINAVFYKKQDYEPFSVPMGYPVLEDINWKAEMKKMDMAVARTMQQAILLITMGTEPDKGGVNQKNLAAMQTLFTNESVGRVLIADYTTKAEFVIPEIGNLLGPEKYEVVDRDIQSGLQNILLSGEKFANQSIKIDVFMARLRQARESFINEFLLPEIKRVSQTMGFKNYPTPYFEHICLSDDATKSRVINRLIELGILTAEEGLTAIDSGRLPTQEESEESQKRFRKLKESGLYEPLVGGGAHPHNPNLGGQPSQGEQSKAEKEGYSLQKISTNMVSANSLIKGVEASLRKYHKIKRLSKRQKSIAHDIVGVIIANEEPQNWRKSIDKYVKKPVDTNDERISKIREISARHHVDEYLASILYISKV